MSTVPFREELANALTHGLGAVVSLAAGAVLVTLAAVFGEARHIAAASVFAASLVMLYTASTLYHAIPHTVAKARLKVFDHCAIYVLIAGTYTPFTIISLRGWWGWGLFATIWSLALAGVIFKLFFTGRFKRTSTVLYVIMGWIVVVAILPLSRAISLPALAFLIAGGVAYTCGAACYLSRRPYAHAVFHLFVLAGSVCHFAAVFTQVVPVDGV
jgi:hemolysin III